MERVIVIGSPGAGKSTFSRKLAKLTSLPLYHLDLIYHRSDRTTIPKDEFDIKLAEIAAKDSWIIDGNYSRTMKMRIEACDTVFFLDYPLEVCLEGARSRVGTKRDDLPWVEDVLDPEFEKCIYAYHKDKLQLTYELLEKYAGKKKIIVFKSREESEEYLQSEMNKRMTKEE